MTSYTKATATHVQAYTVILMMGEVTSMSKDIFIYCDENGLEKDEIEAFLVSEFHVRPTLEMEDDAYWTTEECLISIQPVFTDINSQAIYPLHSKHVHVLEEYIPYAFYAIEVEEEELY